jgi:hypothetical protein
MEYKRFDGESFEDFKKRLYRIVIENYYLTDEEAKEVIDDISERNRSYIASVTFEIKIKS